MARRVRIAGRCAEKRIACSGDVKITGEVPEEGVIASVTGVAGAVAEERVRRTSRIREARISPKERVATAYGVICSRAVTEEGIEFAAGVFLSGAAAEERVVGTSRILDSGTRAIKRICPTAGV